MDGTDDKKEFADTMVSVLECRDTMYIDVCRTTCTMYMYNCTHLACIMV